MSPSLLFRSKIAVPSAHTLKGTLSPLLFLLGLVLLWLSFFELNRAAPYIANASDVIKTRKKQFEASGGTFRGAITGTRIAIFGDSKVLSGFIPDEFDALAAAQGIPVYSFNSGFPAQTEYIDELIVMLNQQPAPDVVLITNIWPKHSRTLSIFSLSTDDNTLADRFFPFRLFMRNVTRFLADSKRFGGVRAFYQHSKDTANAVLAARGYYYIKELNLYPDGKLPPDWHLPSDTPNKIEARDADFESSEFDRLNRAIEQHHVRCFFVPNHHRSTAAAPAPPINIPFASQMARLSTCRVLGPDYLSYSPVLYSDDLHMNPEGARQYTQDIYKLVAPQLRETH